MYMKLIVWLGNPWDKYTKNRHNIWFTIIDQLAQTENIGTFSYNNKFGAEICEGFFEWNKVILAKPMTFMNRSWTPTQAIASFYKIEPADIIVIHDEIDLPTWVVKYKLDWWLAWHNGLKDIANKFGTKAFHRIRIWVDRPANQAHVADYVLSNFKKEEIEFIQDKYLDIIDIIREWI